MRTDRRPSRGDRPTVACGWSRPGADIDEDRIRTVQCLPERRILRTGDIEGMMAMHKARLAMSRAGVAAHPDRAESWSDHGRALFDAANRAIGYLNSGPHSPALDAAVRSHADDLIQELVELQSRAARQTPPRKTIASDELDTLVASARTGRAKSRPPA